MKPETAQSRPTPPGPSTWPRPVIHLILTAASQVMLIATVMLAALLAGWAVLAAALLGSGSTGEQPIAAALAMLLAVTGEGAWPAETAEAGGRFGANLLEAAIQKSVHPEYASRLLAAFPDSTRRPPTSMDVQKRNLSLIEPLSGREIEVLQLIAGGQSNKEVAQKLCISVRTVKYHATNIFMKLEVAGRSQAAAKACEIGLLY